jgi:hypothetical protein
MAIRKAKKRYPAQCAPRGDQWCARYLGPHPDLRERGRETALEVGRQGCGRLLRLKAVAARAGARGLAACSQENTASRKFRANHQATGTLA